MGQTLIETSVEKRGKVVSQEQLSLRAGNYLTALCLFFGAVFAMSLAGSFERQIGNLFSVGLILPSAGFYAGGYVLGQLPTFGVKLSDMMMARCSRHAVYLTNALLNRAGTNVSNWLNDRQA
jgi:hypothetical protein